MFRNDKQGLLKNLWITVTHTDAATFVLRWKYFPIDAARASPTDGNLPTVGNENIFVWSSFNRVYPLCAVSRVLVLRHQSNSSYRGNRGRSRTPSGAFSQTKIYGSIFKCIKWQIKGKMKSESHNVIFNVLFIASELQNVAVVMISNTS